MQQVQVGPARPDDERITGLLQALDAYLYRQYPVEEFGEEVNHILDVPALLRPEVTFIAAWRGSDALGCGAVRRMDDEQGRYGEVKRMYVRPEARGQRIGERLLHSLEEAVRLEGIRRLMLETGSRQPEALRLYERCGWRVRGPFGDYCDGPVTVFMEKQL